MPNLTVQRIIYRLVAQKGPLVDLNPTLDCIGKGINAVGRKIGSSKDIYATGGIRSKAALFASLYNPGITAAEIEAARGMLLASGLARAEQAIVIADATRERLLQNAKEILIECELPNPENIISAALEEKWTPGQILVFFRKTAKMGNKRGATHLYFKALPTFLAKAKSLEELKKWDKEVKSLILDYSQRFVYPWGYVHSALPALLAMVKSLEEFKEVKSLILDYSQRFGEPSVYVQYALPALLAKVKSLEELKEVKSLILDYSQRFGEPSEYVKYALPKLLGEVQSLEELGKVFKITKELISSRVNPSPLADILKMVEDRSIIYQSHRKEFIRFCKNSGPNLANNLEFFKRLNSENAGQLFAESVDYFQDLKTSLFLPLLFDKYCLRDAEERIKLAADFRRYYAAQIEGKTIPAPSLSAEIIEEINYSLIGSASLTMEAYKETLKQAAGHKIPPPNFSQTIELKLQKAKKTGSIPEADIAFLKERIKWIERAIKEGEEIEDIEKAISGFPATDREGRKPTQEHSLKFLRLHLVKSYRTNPDLKTKIDMLIEEKERFSPSDLEIPERLMEVFREIKPEAKEEVRRRIGGMVDVPRLEKIVGRFKQERSEEELTLKLIPAKTELDYFYGYMGENCTSSYPQELLNSAFTPMRIVIGGKIMGSVHTLTLKIDGKKTLVLPGIEPKESLLSVVDAEEFTQAVVKIIIEKICKPNGYARLCLSTQAASQSNRPGVASTIVKLIEGQPRITQTAQSTFPQGSGYSIKELAVVWERN